MGKTSITLAAIADLKKQGYIGKVLLIAPLRVCHSVWPVEIQKWANFNHLKAVVLHGTKKEKLLNEEADIYIINPEGLKWLMGVKKQVIHDRQDNPTKKSRIDYDHWRWRNFGFDTLVIDELSKFKHWSSDRFKMINMVRDTFSRRWGLTGSPAANGLMDLFGQIKTLDGGRSLGPYITQYRMDFFDVDYSGFVYTLKPGADKEIYKRIAPLIMQMKANDYLELPALIENNIYVELPHKAREAYNMMQDLLIAEIDSKVLTAQTAAVKSIKCIAEGTKILTDRGWKPIEQFEEGDLLWDGVEWVSADRLLCTGFKHVVKCYGVYMTRDHEVLTNKGWKQAQEILNGESSNRYDRKSVRLPDGFRESWKQTNTRKFCTSFMETALCVWERSCLGGKLSQIFKTRRGEVMWMQERCIISKGKGFSWYDKYNTFPKVEQNVVQMSKSIRQRLEKLWWSWDQSMQKVANISRFLEGYGGRLQTESYAGQEGCEWRVQQRELLLGNHERTEQKQKRDGLYRNPQRKNDYDGSIRSFWSKVCNLISKSFQGKMAPQQLVYKTDKRKVFDIINSGPRQRFTVMGDDGKALIIHNCRQIASGAIFTNDIKEITGFVLPTGPREWITVHDEKLDALEGLIDELQGSPLLVAYEFEHDLVRLKERFGKDTPHIGKGVTPVKGRQIEADWNAGKIPVLFGQAQSMGHGLNLQGCGNHVCWFTLTWNFENYDQFIKRVLRQGNDNKHVFVHHILAKDTIDDLAVLPTLKSRDHTQQGLFKGLQKLRR